MTPVIESLFDEADSRYLKPPALKEVTTYVASLTERVSAYRLMRDRELKIMQTVADHLTASLPDESIARVEQTLKMAILILRHSSMAMLMEDANYLEERFLPYLRETREIHATESVDALLYPALRNQLNQLFNDRQLALLTPYLDQAQRVLISNVVDVDESLLTMSGMF